MGEIQPLTLVVLAAGIGSRFGRVKQIEPVGPSGEALVDYSIYDALTAGFERVVFVIGEGMEAAFKRRFSPLIGLCDLSFVTQRLDDLPAGFTVPPGRSKPWGTAHALLSCRGELDGPFAVINADDFYGAGAFAALARSLTVYGDEEGILIGYRVEGTVPKSGPVSRGICRVDGSGYLVGIAEHRAVGLRGGRVGYEEGGIWHEIPEGTIASMNMWGLPVGFLRELEGRFLSFLGEGDLLTAEYQLPTVIGELIREGRLRVRVVRTEEEWFGLTHPDDLPRVRAAIERLVTAGSYPTPLFG